MSRTTERILVVKLADIGDAVLALPSIQSLRAAYPDARIDILTTEAGANVFQMSDSVDDVITLAKQRFDHIRGLVSFGGFAELAKLTFTLRSRRYDTVVLLHHLTTSFGASKFRALANATGAAHIAGLDNGRGGFLTLRATDYGFGTVPEWQYNLNVVALLGASPVPVTPRLSIPDEVSAAANGKLREIGAADRYAVMHTEVGEFSPARAWKPEYFLDVAHAISRDYGMPVVLVGTDPANDLLLGNDTGGNVHSLVGKTSFQELCAVVRRAALVIGCDSSVAHLAGAFQRRSLTLFGPSNVDAWKPYGSAKVAVGETPDQGRLSIALHRDMPCSPCIYTGFRLGRPQGCRSRSCMMDMESSAVISLLPHILQVDGTRNKTS